jgi:hypothetical protein
VEVEQVISIFRVKEKTKKETASSTCHCGPAFYLLHAGFFLGVLFDPEDGSYIVLRNVGCFSTDYRALYSET